MYNMLYIPAEEPPTGAIVQVCSSRNKGSPFGPTIGVSVMTQVSTIGPPALFSKSFVKGV